jgi:hypothetical protein
MSEIETYTSTVEQHRERARLLRAHAEAISADGRRRFLEVADELDQLADGMDPRAA